MRGPKGCSRRSEEERKLSTRHVKNWQGVVDILFLRVRGHGPRQPTVASLNLAARYETPKRSAVISFWNPA